MLPAGQGLELIVLFFFFSSLYVWNLASTKLETGFQSKSVLAELDNFQYLHSVNVDKRVKTFDLKERAVGLKLY